MAGRRVKIVCTLGPASQDEATVAAMIRAGMDVARVNMSHGTRQTQEAAIAAVRAAGRRLGRHVAVMVDLRGPKLRTGDLPGGPLRLADGREVVLTTGPAVAGAVPVDYAALPNDVAPGDPILLADGAIELRVRAVRGTDVVCRVLHGGVLADRQGINLPRSQVSAPSLTDKDRADLAFAVGAEADFLAVSFVRSAADVNEARAEVERLGGALPVIAKLEKRQALDRLPEIVAASDAVMVARGDMGVELAPERVPHWQKRIIDVAREGMVPAITATQMLESMIERARPTRAEASDVAHAVWDGTDAVMLSAETAVGRDPVAAVRMMDRIVRAAEADPAYFADRPRLPRPTRDPSGTIAYAVRSMPEVDRRIKGVVAFTRTGYSARLVSMERAAVPIAALAYDEATARRVQLLWGVTPAVVEEPRELPAMIVLAEDAARRLLGLRDGDQVVMIGSQPPEAGVRTNFLRLHRVGGGADPAP